MHSTQFDRLTVALGSRLSRRQAIAGGTAGLAAVGLSRLSQTGVAQDATPAAQTTTPSTVYVQLADTGTWLPKPDAPGVYLLTLYGPGEQTLSFTLAPDKFVATIPTGVLLETLGFTPEYPPNAAIEVVTLDGERDVLVVALMNPTFIPGTDEGAPAVLTYEAHILSAYTGTGLDEWSADVDDDELPAEFEQVSLFIDNGCQFYTGCYVTAADGTRTNVGGVPGTSTLMRCPGFEPGTCMPCSGNSQATLNARCNTEYAACNGNCIAD